MIKCAYTNILESSSVTLAVGTEDPACPLYRLSDRNIGRMFQPLAASTVTVKIDQGSSPAAVDRLIIPAGHNLDGIALALTFSDNDVSYTSMVPGWTAQAGVIEKSWAAATHRYWKFTITNPSVVPALGELFLSATYEWERNPARPQPSLEPVFNVRCETTSSGQDRFLVSGEAKRRRLYTVGRCSQVQADLLSST